MSKFVKKELTCNKYLFYCYLAMRSKKWRVREKAEKIVDHQISEYLYF